MFIEKIHSAIKFGKENKNFREKHVIVITGRVKRTKGGMVPLHRQKMIPRPSQCLKLQTASVHTVSIYLP